MSACRGRITKTTGVTLEIPVLQYLAELAQKEDRDRSYCINRIVREHAQQHGRCLPSAAPTPNATLNLDPKEP